MFDFTSADPDVISNTCLTPFVIISSTASEISQNAGDLNYFTISTGSAAPAWDVEGPAPKRRP